ncbi:MAG: hypothetical protein ACLRZ6_08620 [Lachnospiraceae bacterium]
MNRYSNRRDSAMTLRGIRGKVWFEGADGETMKLLFAGELLRREEYEFWVWGL